MNQSNAAETSSRRWAEDRIFSAAWAFDLAFAWDVAPEVDTALAVAGLRTADAEVGALLLPACGTGRYALDLAERGYVVDASDINPGMIARANEERAHHRVRYTLADMTKPLGAEEGDCAAAFTFCNSFRYVLEDAEIDGHLAAVHRRLRRGGVYVIQLGLNMEAKKLGPVASWLVQHEDGTQAKATWSLEESDPPRSLEIARICVTHPNGATSDFVERQPQRLWSPATLEATATRAGFMPHGIFSLDGSLASDRARPGRYYVALRRP